ncbi:hypothetical protein KUTeg_009029 [Tegillarca granosa]|uniref:Alpha-mannosidase n=1 Tax=Tegillarca granosa TaxID=220873 RepID=A0ABQ9F7P9_TEGGR|nr:hypothetical protein KUTeg_009029 [Tegillarca granosa]
MQDRRLNQDDNRGLGQGVRDNVLTPNRFNIYFEKRKSPLPKDKMNGYPSLQSHMTYLHLVHPLFVIPQSDRAGSISVSPLFSPLSKPLPCDIHLLNLRTLQNKDDNKEVKYIPRDESALLLHHLGIDCGFPNQGLFCEASEGKVVLQDLFKDVKIQTVTETSLSLLHDNEELEPSASLKLNPMEIYTYRVKIQ